MLRRWRVLLIALVMLLALGQPVLAQGSSGSQVIFGRDVTLAGGERVAGDLVVFGGNVTLQPDSGVGGNVLAFGGTVEIAGRVDGDVFAFGGDVRVRPAAMVGGDALATGDVVAEQGAVISGTTGGLSSGINVPRWSGLHWSWPSDANRWAGGWPADPFAWIYRTFMRAVVVAALGIVAILLVPGPTRRVCGAMVGSPAESVGLGLLTGLMAVLGLPILVLTILGIPLAVLAALALAGAVAFGWVAAGLAVGERILARLQQTEPTAVATVAVGLLSLALLTSIPCLGALASLAVGAWGVGAVVLTRFGTRPYAGSSPRPASPPPMPPAVRQ